MKDLDELDTVDWSDLEHAYGPAVGVPRFFEELTSEDWETCEEAYFELLGRICHQGSVYEASVEALPFVVGLASREQGPTSLFAGALLALIAWSGFGPVADEGPADDAARRRVRERLGEQRSELEQLRGELAEADPRRRAIDAILDLMDGPDVAAWDAVMEAYTACEGAAIDQNAERQQAPSVEEFERWLEQSSGLDRREQVHAVGWARAHAREHPEAAARALARVSADHLLPEKRVAEVLVTLGLGDERAAREHAIALAEEWLEPAEAGGFNQAISRQTMLSLFDEFEHPQLASVRERVEEADEPEWVISEDW